MEDNQEESTAKVEKVSIESIKNYKSQELVDRIMDQILKLN